MLKNFYKTNKNQAFYISLKNNKLTQIDICFNKKEKENFEYVYSVDLPDETPNLQIRLDIDKNILLKGFQLFTQNKEGQLEILDTGISDSLYGFYHEGSSLVYNPKMLMNIDEYDFTRIVESNMIDPDYFQLDYIFTASEDSLTEPTKISTFIQSKNKQTTLTFKPKNGTHSVYFHPGMLQLQPSYFYFKAIPENFKISKFLIIQNKNNSGQNTLKPLPADLGSINQFKQSNWRNEKYELFSWNLYPNVLIFDTLDYEVQSRFFKRLAFFTEKKGYIGQVLDNASLENKHGWNAHDYKALDLARFFTIATAKSINLFPEEWLLRNILLEQSIISQSASEYLPNTGAVISVSRASGRDLHKTLLAHEALHGAFFTNSAFRLGVENLWQGLPYSQKEMWKMFFSTLSYNPEDELLMANEYMAYLLQYERKTSFAYLNDYKIPQAASRHPELASILLGPINNNPHLILDLHSQIEDIAYRTAGLRGGLNSCLEIP
ncbi:MAG: hypothetical protein JXR70_08595 [Spirochaetales bacterium]|nr:hypothetical protein [Spirochaetales bacterium]